MGVGASSVGATARAVPSESRSTGDGYFVDSLFRSNNPGSESPSVSVRSEAALILANGLQQGAVSSDDQSYLARLVMARTGMNQTDADQRVSNVLAKAKQAAETLRKATAHLLLWTFVSLLIGAFCGSLAATIGGKQRDHVAAVSKT